jgi:hypothetical protein
MDPYLSSLHKLNKNKNTYIQETYNKIQLHNASEIIVYVHLYTRHIIMYWQLGHSTTHLSFNKQRIEYVFSVSLV